MEQIINAITPAIEKLAEVFNCSVDFIQAHAMEYILMYGKYHCITSILNPVLFIGSLVSLIIGGILFFVSIDEWSCDVKHPVLMSLGLFLAFSVIVFIVLFIIMGAANGIPYMVSPEIYSIKAVLELIK